MSKILQNYWYAAAWDHEVSRSLLARTICNEPVVMYRRQDGAPVALFDRCWHRLAPLHLGRLVDDQVICGYHGLVFDCDGKCTDMPSQDVIPETARVKSYPVVERHRFIWIWIGDEDKADESLIPDLHENAAPEWVGEGGTIDLKADYKLLIDNLMDLTHETYVHTTTIGDKNLPGSPIKTESDDDTVTVTRWILDHQPAPFWKNAIGSDENCDRWQIIKFRAPSTIVIDVGVAIAGTGAPEGDRSRGVNGTVINAITPQTENSTWYFWNLTRNFKINDRRLTREIQKNIAGVFAEDVEILEGQQQAIEQTPDRRLVSMNIDAGGRRARMILERLESENETKGAA